MVSCKMNENIHGIKIFLSSSKNPDLFKTFQKAATYLINRHNALDKDAIKVLFEQEFRVCINENIEAYGRTYDIEFESELDYIFFLMKWS